MSIAAFDELISVPSPVENVNTCVPNAVLRSAAIAEPVAASLADTVRAVSSPTVPAPIPVIDSTAFAVGSTLSAFDWSAMKSTTPVSLSSIVTVCVTSPSLTCPFSVSDSVPLNVRLTVSSPSSR